MVVFLDCIFQIITCGFIFDEDYHALSRSSRVINSRARTLNRKLDQAIGLARNPSDSIQVLENRLFSIIAHIAKFVHKNTIYHLLIDHFFDYSFCCYYTNKENCLAFLLFSCLFSSVHPVYVVSYTCIASLTFKMAVNFRVGTSVF